MDKLLNCPFCGGNAYHYQDFNGISIDDMTVKSGVMHFIMCRNCSALVSGNSKTEAIDAWNRRAGND